MSNASPSIAEQAAALLAEVERTLAEGDERLRAMGLNPEKVRAHAQQATPAQRQEAEEAVRRDLAEVEQTVAEERARQQAGRPSGATPVRKPRRFV